MRPFSTLLTLLCAWTSPSFGAAVVPDERDREVLETLAEHLLSDTTFVMSRSTNGSTLVLHIRTPEKVGLLTSHQTASDLGDRPDRKLPEDGQKDLEARNQPNNATYDAAPAFYTHLTFAAAIVVADLDKLHMPNRPDGVFKGAYPNARGWMRSYLPGYSKDGTQAVVRASVGPSPHGAMLTALLEKSGGKWVVKWHHVTFFV